MPYRGEHSARITDAEKYKEFRRRNDAGGDGVHFIFGIWTDEEDDRKSEVHAIRFDSSRFNVSESKKWLKDHGYKAEEFEEALPEETDEEKDEHAAATPMRRVASAMTAIRGFRDSSVWLADASYLEAAIRASHAGVKVQKADATLHLQQGQGKGNSVQVAIVEIDGLMLKRGGWYGLSTASVRDLLRDLSLKDNVGAIMLAIDSPGGSVAGTKELADEVRRIDRDVKPVYAYIEDLGASAAYWVASQTRRIFSNELAEVGSIGTYAVVYDTSKMYEEFGIKVHVVSSGGLKGAFMDGTKISKEMLADLQGIVDQLTDVFVGQVAEGRGMETKAAKKLADGRVHLAAKALELGLVDEVLPSRDHALARIVEDMSADLNKKRAQELTQRLAQARAETIGTGDNGKATGD